MSDKDNGELMSAREKPEFKSVDNAIEKAGEALLLSQNTDGGWGRLENDDTDPWNTSFILDCLLRALDYRDMNKKSEKKEFKKDFKRQIDYLRKSCCEFIEKNRHIENENENEETKSASNKPMRESELKENHKIVSNYPLAHSAIVLIRIQDIEGNKDEELIREIVKYLIGINNDSDKSNKDKDNNKSNKDNNKSKYWGWGWNKFSSSNIYGTVIVVNALLDYYRAFPNKRNELKEPIFFGMNWILQNQNRDNGWGVERGSDPKHTAMALLTILWFLDLFDDPESEKPEQLAYGYKDIKEKVQKASEWLCSQWPDKDSKLFKVQSSIPGKGWRVEDSRYVDKCGFEPTAYGLWALIELVRKEKLALPNLDDVEQNLTEVEQNLTDGLLWLLSSQERNGSWHEYELRNDKMGGDCYNFYPALGILVLSLFKKEYGENRSKEKIIERLIENKLILLARLSYFKDSKLITRPEKPFLIRIYPLSLIFSYQAVLILVILAALTVALFCLNEKDISTESIVAPSYPPHLFLIVGAAILFVLVIVEMDLASDRGLIIRKFTSIKKWIGRELSCFERFIDLMTCKSDSEIQDNAIEKAWEALLLSQNPDGGWGRFKNNETDLWNTSYILDCLLKVYRYSDIKNEIRKPLDLVAERCDEFVKRDHSDNKEEIERIVRHVMKDYIEPKEKPATGHIDNYALAHSLSVFSMTKEKEHREIAKKIARYLVSGEARNEDHGWGWDKFSSSNIYGTAIVVNALMDAREEIPLVIGGKIIEDAIYEGIKWILDDCNLDGGWGSERGSCPKHTALALLTILRFLTHHDNLKESMEENLDDVYTYAGCLSECINKCIKWLSSEWPKKEESKLLGVNSMVPGKGWRVKDSRYPDRVGFESTAYALWTLIELVSFSKSEKLVELTVLLNLLRQIESQEIEKKLEKSCRWISWNQEWDGCWYEYESKEGNMDGDCYNFYQALGILVLSLYKKKIEKGNIGELLSENMVLKEKLSTFRYPGLVTLSRRLFIIFSWITLSFLIAIVFVGGYLELENIQHTCRCVSDYLRENPSYLAIGTILVAITTWRGRVLWFLKKVKESVTYGQKHS